LDPSRVDRSLPVEFIRTVAIVLVILLHAAIEPVQLADEMSPAGVSLWWTVNVYSSLARPAVPLFVMLSGVLLLQPSKAAEPLKDFFKKRMKRIATPFLFWGIIYFIWRFLVNQEPFSYEQVITGVLTGPYYHFWFLYMLIGLYLITPILRVVVAHAEWKTSKYFLLLWFIGTAVIPLIALSGTFYVNNSIFIMTGWIGYFFLGAYVHRIHFRPIILYLTLVLGILGTIVGTYIVTGALGARQGQVINDPASISSIAASVTLFLILSTFPFARIKSQNSHINRMIRYISQNTLAIYLLHVIVLGTFQKGYLGFNISLLTLDPVLEVPLITAVTLFACLGIIYVLKKIPYVGKIIG
jgi:surface polysaccharide O-acyltransferase-like enzyme